MREAAKPLRDNSSVVNRRADKSSTFLIHNKADYLQKLETLLNDQAKYAQISQDSTEQLQRRVNKLILKTNCVVGPKLLNPRVGCYTPVTIYGKVKTHKDHQPLRPIILQVTSPIHNVAK